MQWGNLKVHLVLAVLLSIIFYWMEKDYGVFTNILYIIIYTPSDNQIITNQLKINPTSVHCWGNNHTNRICYFTNLYFSVDIKEFVFVHGDESLHEGIPEDVFNPSLLDMSSVEDHNTQYFTYVDVELEKFQNSLYKNFTIIDELTFSLRRFLPGNLMHIFHDDLLPIFYTIELFKSKSNFTELNLTPDPDIGIFFADDWPPGEYNYLYDIFSSNKKPMYKYDLLRLNESALICFAKILVGVLKHTTWYQYGFKTRQGPLNNVQINGTLVHRFTDYYKMKMNISGSLRFQQNKMPKGLLLVRRKNRLILNEVELVSFLINELGIKVRTMSLESHPLNEIISEISTAEFIIGMHGSILILSLFLSPGSLLVELFPYAINPNKYTPYCNAVGLIGVNISYVAWQNVDPHKTVTHPNRPAEEGGIGHLDPKEQEKILNSDEVPDHLCCQDPAWLYRIYQDTIVDASEIIKLIKNKRANKLSGLAKNCPKKVDSKVRYDYLTTVSKIEYFKDIFKNSILGQNRTMKLRPYRVSNINCRWQLDSSLKIAWHPPNNIQYLEYRTITYEIILQRMDREINEDLLSAGSDSNGVVISGELVDQDEEYMVWVRCAIDSDVRGPFNDRNVIC